MNTDANTLIDSSSNVTLALKWYGAHQNNSGGSYVIDDAVAQWVFVQAASAADAQVRMEEITERSGYDWCECCGRRWYFDFDESDGHPEPMVFDEPMRSRAEDYWTGSQVRLHAYDGRVAEYTL